MKITLILMGVQGCGKGTQADLLEQRFSWKHINIGDLFRSNISNGTELGKQAKAHIDRGDLVPDELVFELISQALAEAEGGVILDGFPRNLEQAKFLDDRVLVNRVYLLELADETAVARISARRNCRDCKRVYNLVYNPPRREKVCDVCGGELIRRADDNPDAVRQRISKFHEETEPVIRLYEKRGILKRIDAGFRAEVVQQIIIEDLQSSGVYESR
ncbi:MAG: nucleoside monophosphate kinase [Candidatus Cloacimonetes bacterium]|nr:nucleoside monophosphate kinase [Candidatus Cloacimonadota bacterium]